jgi:hypothetical protein
MKIPTLFPFVPAVRPLALACTTALLLSACVSTGQYKVDPPSVPAVYGRGDAQRNAPTEASDAVPTLRADVRDDAWWTGFGDPRLDRVIDRALQANTDLASAGLAVQRARLQAGLSDNALWLQPSAAAAIVPLIRAPTGTAAVRPACRCSGRSTCGAACVPSATSRSGKPRPVRKTCRTPHCW